MRSKQDEIEGYHLYIRATKLSSKVNLCNTLPLQNMTKLNKRIHVSKSGQVINEVNLPGPC